MVEITSHIVDDHTRQWRQQIEHNTDDVNFLLGSLKNLFLSVVYWVPVTVVLLTIPFIFDVIKYQLCYKSITVYSSFSWSFVFAPGSYIFCLILPTTLSILRL